MPILWPTLVILLLILREQSARRERARALASGDVDALLEPYPSGLFRWHSGAADDPQVRAEKTPASRGEVLGAVAQAWRNVAGDEPTALGVLMLSAQSDLETGSFHALYNWNLGNLTHVTGDGHPWVLRPEVTAPLRFRAYDSLLRGAEDLVRWAQKRRLLDAAARGDLDAYVAGLKAGCYLGCVGQGPVTDQTYDQYRSGIIARARLFEHVEPIAPPTPGPPAWALALGAALLAIGGWWYLGPKVPADVLPRVKGLAWRVVGRQPKAAAAAVVIDGASGAAVASDSPIIDATPQMVVAAAAATPLPPGPAVPVLPPSCGCAGRQAEAA